MAQDVKTEAETRRLQLDPSSESEVDQDEFSRPSAKRRRTSSEEEDEAVPIPYSTLSRVRKSAPLTTEEIDTTPTEKTTSVPSTLTNSTFDDLNVSPWLVHSLKSMAITNPTEIQRSCIPEILKGRDCIGGSKTGTGKTVAFAVPILQKWAEDPFGIYAVIITPTRELALQIYEQFLALGASQSLKVVLVTGGSDMRPQALALSQRPHIVVATPGRLADHIRTSGKETTIGLTRAKVVVLDEADRLLASGHGSMLPDLSTCLSALPSSASRLTLLFTATVTPEVRELKSLPRQSTRPPIFVSEIADPSTLAKGSGTMLPSTLIQTYLIIPLTQKDAFLHALLLTPSLSNQANSIIIFTNRTTTADILHRTLLTLSHSITSLHSQLPQSQRNRNLASFRSHKARILIATDVASRGLDVPDVGYVINYDVPRDPLDYVHRVGRTARAGRPGTSITFVGQRDIELIHAIEEHVGGGHAERGKMQEWTEEGVNIETRVVKGRTLKDVAEARMEAIREVEGGREVGGWKRGVIRKDRRRFNQED